MRWEDSFASDDAGILSPPGKVILQTGLESVDEGEGHNDEDEEEDEDDEEDDDDSKGRKNSCKTKAPNER